MGGDGGLEGYGRWVGGWVGDIRLGWGGGSLGGAWLVRGIE